MITKADVNKTILMYRPNVTIMAHNGIILGVEIDLFNDHIDWYVQDGECFYDCKDDLEARDKFLEILDK